MTARIINYIKGNIYIINTHCMADLVLKLWRVETMGRTVSTLEMLMVLCGSRLFRQIIKPHWERDSHWTVLPRTMGIR